MPSSVPASPLRQSTTTQSTIGAAVTALVGFPIVLIIVALAAAIVGSIGIAALGIELPAEDEIRAWARRGPSVYVKLIITLLTALTTFLALFLAFLIFRRANKKRAILFFAAGYVASVMAMVLSGDFLAGWFLQGAVLTCVVYFIRLRAIETVTPP